MTSRTLFGVCALALLGSANPLAGQISYPVDFRAGVFTGGTKRNVAVDNSVTERLDASVKGFEVMLSGAQGTAGLGGRYMDGTFGTEKLTIREGRVFVGESWFRVEGAYGDRSIFGIDSTVTFIRAGARSIVRIGGSGISLSASGSKYFAGDFWKKKPVESSKTDGWEAETAIFYTTPRIPAFLQLGYRTEYFSFGNREEHVSGVLLGMGVWLGGR